MTSPTIPPQPEPERVCGNCEFFKPDPPSWGSKFGDCSVCDDLPPCFKGLRMDKAEVRQTHTCVLFRARTES